MPAHGPAWSGSSSFDRLALLTTQREAVGPEAKKDFVDPHTRWVGTWSPKKSVGVADRSGGDPIVRRRFARVRKAGRKAAREKREVSARATDWTHDPGTTVTGQRIFQRPAAAASPPSALGFDRVGARGQLRGIRGAGIPSWLRPGLRSSRAGP